jgi:hypothetical protein
LAQVIPTQLVLVQSAPTKHILALAQVLAGAQEPPQSTSVSLPFFKRSVQEGAVHTCVAAGQMPLVQSAATKQVRPVAHVGHDPPQFRSVSVPFLTASVHEGGAQNPATQTLLVQSALTPHAWPSVHLGHDAPPQFRSLSVPF